MKKLNILILGTTFALTMSPLCAAPAPLTLTKTTVVPGGPGEFDFMWPDPVQDRIYATHPGKNALTVLSLQTGTVQDLPTGCEVNGVACDTKHNKLYTAGGGKKLIVFDLTTLAKKSELDLDGPADDIVIDPANGTLYIDHDDGAEAWILDTNTDKITGSVAIDGAPEYLVYEPTTDRLYQNIKPANSINVIDPSTNKVVEKWSTLPAKSPHGLAIDVETGRVFTAGKNGKLAILDIKNGKTIGSVDIAPGVDQIAFDSGLKRIYCASGKGILSIVQEDNKGGAKLIADFAVPAGAHTVTVNPVTHDVWISYPDATNSNLACYSAGK